MRSKRNDAIQGLRAIAALLVVITHSILNLIQRANYDPDTAHLVYGLGELGVKMFFVISGFIMATTMYDSFARPGAPTTFMLKRIMRIVPIYWLATLIYAAKLSLTGDVPRWDELLLSLFFIPYDHGQLMREPLYGLGWTLNYEMFFYCLFSLSLFLPRRSGFGLLLSLLAALAAIGAIGMLAGCSGPLCVIADYFTRPIILFFAAGILLALARRWLEARQKVPEISTRTAIATSLVVAFLYGAAVISGLVQENTASSALVQALACGIATTVCGLEVYSGGPNGFYRSLLLALGNASYSIYLTHSFIMGSAGRIWALISNGYVSTMSAVIFVMLMILGASILGILSYRYVERPLLDLLRSRVTGDRQAVA
jgi:peptidoglycan/LPS O-acetylase OafA/YrhL